MSNTEIKKQRSIKNKVVGLSLMIFFILVSQGLYSYFASTSIESQSTQIKDKIFPSIQFVNEFAFSVTQMRPLLEEAVIDEDEYVLDEALALGNQGVLLLDSIALYTPSSLVDSLRDMFTLYLRLCDELIRSKIEGEMIDVSSMRETSGIFNLIERFKEEKSEEIKDNFRDITSKANSFLWIALGIFILLVAVFGYFTGFITNITMLLKKLSQDASIIRGGKLDHKITQTRSDELGELQHNFDEMRVEIKDFIENLDQKVKEKTKEISEEKRKIADLLNNMKQAVFKIDSKGIILSPVSHFTTDVLEGEVEGLSVFETAFKDLDPLSEASAALNSAMVAVFGEDDLQWDLVVDSLPTKISRLRKQDGVEQILKLNYCPIWSEDGLLTEIMLVVEDITELERLARENMANEERIRIIEGIAKVKMDELQDFLTTCSIMLKTSLQITHQQVLQKEDFQILFRELHTVKGNSRIYGFKLLASAAHEVETLAADMRTRFENGEAINRDEVNQIKAGILQLFEVLGRYSSLAHEIFKIKPKLTLQLISDIHRQFYECNRILTLLEKSGGTEQEKADLVQSVLFLISLVKVARIQGLEEALAQLEEVAAQPEVNVAGIMEEYNRIKFRIMYLPSFHVPKTLSDRKDEWFGLMHQLIQVHNVCENFKNDPSKMYLVRTAVGGLKTQAGQTSLRVLLEYADDFLQVLKKSDHVPEDYERYTSKIWDYFGLVFSLLLAHDLKNAVPQCVAKDADYSSLNNDLIKLYAGNDTPVQSFLLLLRDDASARDIFWRGLIEKSGLCSREEWLKEVLSLTPEAVFAILQKVRQSAGKMQVHSTKQLTPFETKVNSFFARHEDHAYGMLWELSQMLQDMKLEESRIAPESGDALEVNRGAFIKLKGFMNQLPAIKDVPDHLPEMIRLFNGLLDVDLKRSLGKYHEMVEVLAQKLKKKVELRITGDHILISKDRLHPIHDILVHMIRNSLDHGVEDPEVRTANNKQAAGKIFVECKRLEDGFSIEVRDDGQGIDFDRLQAKAVESRILTADEAAKLTPEEKKNLLFMPNLSSKEAVTELSGRGVGMDVVANNVQKLGGSIELHSEKGKGSTFKIFFRARKV
jgi:signal transduction histidine kinase/HPt (histidine-containing phosphotransfer) domain-containing protein